VRLTLVLIGFLVAAWGSVSASPAQATFPGRNGLIAFDERFCCPDADELHSIFALDSAGVRHNLLDDYWTPSFSPDGRHLAFVGWTLQWASISGFRVGRIHEPGHVGNAFDPVWSPGGDRLAYEAGSLLCGGQQRVRSIRTNGRDRRRLTFGGDPAWSSTGLIAFVKAAGRHPGNLCSNRLGIYTMNSRGRHVRALTSGNADREPDWSPDGRSVVFARTRGATAGIYVVDSGSRALRRLTSTPGGNDGDPTWSPDATQILFVRETNLWVMNSDGSNQRLVTAHNPATDHGSGSYEMYSTAWQPLPG
jgi:hypothetical protein